MQPCDWDYIWHYLYFNTSKRPAKETTSVKEQACWLWRGPLKMGGYGKGQFRQITSTHVLAALLRQEHGPTLRVPRDADDPNKPAIARHQCPGKHNPQCCSPYHLQFGSFADNMQDRVANGTSRTRVVDEDVKEAILQSQIPSLELHLFTQTERARHFNVALDVVRALDQGPLPSGPSLKRKAVVLEEKDARRAKYEFLCRLYLRMQVQPCLHPSLTANPCWVLDRHKPDFAARTLTWQHRPLTAERAVWLAFDKPPLGPHERIVARCQTPHCVQPEHLGSVLQPYLAETTVWSVVCQTGTDTQLAQRHFLESDGHDQAQEPLPLQLVWAIKLAYLDQSVSQDHDHIWTDILELAHRSQQLQRDFFTIL